MMALGVTTLASAQTKTMRVATYNMRYANHDDSLEGNGWMQRYPVIAQLVRFHDFDIFGTQEGLYHQLTELKGSLPGYEYIGIGRDDGQHGGEHSAIFYKSDRFDLLQHGDFWLSTVTDRPNKGWDAVLPRICTWGKFKDKRSGFVFTLFNLHMDHIGVKARAESARLVLAKIKAMTPDSPVILTGDFNVDQRSESYSLINNSGVLRDAFELAPVREATNGTFNDFDLNRKTESRIDHIFLSKAFHARRYGILTDSYLSPVAANDSSVAGKDGRWVARPPSDHFPVMVELEY